MASPRRSTAIRGGFTLMELLIVITILAAMAALGWPRVRTSFEKSQLREAARSVCIELSRARLGAIEAGETRQFRYAPGGSRYEVGRRVMVQDMASIINPYENTSPPVLEAELPGGILFAPPETSSEVTPLPLDADTSVGAEQWGPPIVFLPNGRTSNARLKLISPQQFSIEITLRGLTGTAQIGTLQQGEPQP